MFFESNVKQKTTKLVVFSPTASIMLGTVGDPTPLPVARIVECTLCSSLPPQFRTTDEVLNGLFEADDHLIDQNLDLRLSPGTYLTQRSESRVQLIQASIATPGRPYSPTTTSANIGFTPVDQLVAGVDECFPHEIVRFITICIGVLCKVGSQLSLTAKNERFQSGNGIHVDLCG